jgi:hypothetical protein
MPVCMSIRCDGGDAGKVGAMLTMGRIAALRLDAPANRAWLDRFAVDHRTYFLLKHASRDATGAGATSFRGDRLVIWEPVADARYAVIGRVEDDAAFYAIPRGAALPPGTDADTSDEGRAP